MFLWEWCRIVFITPIRRRSHVVGSKWQAKGLDEWRFREKWRFCGNTSPPFQRNTPKSLKEKTPYRIKILLKWLAICILTVWSRRWAKMFLTKWLKHYTNQQHLTTHPDNPHDGNPTALMTRNIIYFYSFMQASIETAHPTCAGCFRTRSNGIYCWEASGGLPVICHVIALFGNSVWCSDVRDSR